MPKRKQSRAAAASEEPQRPAVRSLWSGTITFGLVSIPVELLSAVRPRQTALKLVDKSGHALGRQYRCSKENKKLDNDDLVRGYETTDGKMVEITDAEIDSVAPEMSADIELRSFVPLAQIPQIFFQKPYFLAPAGKSSKAYHLLTATMEQTGRVAIGSFVMRGHEYLVAIVADNGVLRADTLRYNDEIRTPASIGLPKVAKAPAKKVSQFAKDIDELTRAELDVAELADQDAKALEKLVEAKQEEGDAVIHPSGMEEADDSEGSSGGAEVIDLMDRLRKSLSKNVRVTTAEASPPIDLAAHRAKRKSSAEKSSPPTKTATKRKAPRKRSRRA